MAKTQDTTEKIVSLSKRKGFVFQSSEIYGGLNGCYDFGPLGVELLRNIKEAWWKEMTSRINIEGIDSSILMHPKVWEASGHVQNFTDPMVDCKNCKARYRVDVLISSQSEKQLKNITSEIFKLYSSEADKPSFYLHVINKLIERIPGFKNTSIDNFPIDPLVNFLKKTYKNDDKLLAFIEDSILKNKYSMITLRFVICPNCGTKGEFTNAKQFNLMFRTFIGPVEDSSNAVYLRPETAQGIFVNFLNVKESSRQKLPFGIAQIGKSFRNEINTKNFLFRVREFEQMEMQFFVKPGEDDKWFDYWKETRMNWFLKYGFKKEKLRYFEHVKLAHYAKAAFDIEYEFPFGWGEIEGIHNRTDFDLSRHSEFSGKKLEYYDDQTKERFIPYVIETAVGATRSFMAFLIDAYEEEEVKKTNSDGTESSETRTVMRFHPALAPVKAAIFPLVNRDGMPEIADSMREDLRKQFKTFYDDSGAVGRRYRRQDENGTPFCITVDSQTLEDGTVTVRERDSMEQVRINKDNASQYIKERIAY